MLHFDQSSLQNSHPELHIHIGILVGYHTQVLCMLVYMMGLAYKLGQGDKQGLTYALERGDKWVYEQEPDDKREQGRESVHVQC